MSYTKQFLKGLFSENPTLVQLIGMCPVLAITTTLMNGIGMGISVVVVLTFSNIVISLLRKTIPDKIRIAAYVVIIAGFVSIIDMILKAYFPAISASLGIFIPLIVVNCIILARAEAFASKNTVFLSAIDGLSMGLGFTGALIIISSIREILGSGSILGVKLFGAGFEPILFFALPPGAFLVLGIIIGLIKFVSLKKGGKVNA